MEMAIENFNMPMIDAQQQELITDEQAKFF
jgi:hypothetical protein